MKADGSMKRQPAVALPAHPTNVPSSSSGAAVCRVRCSADVQTAQPSGIRLETNTPSRLA
jgi:hypothetical protein